MADDTATFFDRWRNDAQKMKEQAPAVQRAFGAFHQALMKEGALSVREKELIALAIGLAVRCLPCINLHVKNSLKAGATREQILEAAGVAVMMQGGPSFTYLPEVIRAQQQLSANDAS